MSTKNYPRVQIIINADSSEDLTEAVGWLDKSSAQQTPSVKTEKKADSPVKTEKLAVKTEDVAAEKTVKVEMTTEKPTKPVVVKLDDLRKKLSAVLHAGKRADAKALLEEFGAPKLGDLVSEKYADFDKRLDELLEGK